MCFSFPLLILLPVFLFFSLLHLPMRFLLGSTWSLFRGISLLLSRPRLCVYVCLCGGELVGQNWGLLLFVDTAGVDFAPQWLLCLFHLYSSQAHKGQNSTGCQAEGHRRDKREAAFSLPYILVGSVSTAFTFRKHTTAVSRPLIYLFFLKHFCKQIYVLNSNSSSSTSR